MCIGPLSSCIRLGSVEDQAMGGILGRKRSVLRRNLRSALFNLSLALEGLI